MNGNYPFNNNVIQHYTKPLMGLLLICLVCLPLKAINNKDRRPNIIFLFADDHSYNALHAAGNKEIKTPNLDRMAESGVSFTRAFNMGAWQGAVCLASRTMINTGRSVWNAKNMQTRLKNGEACSELWGNLLKNAGYDTYMTGKWHVKTDVNVCFETTGSLTSGMPLQTKDGYNRPLSKNDQKWSPWNTEFGGYWEGGKHWSEVTGNQAIDFINQAQHKENPFFMYVAFNAPHDPRQSPKQYVDMYPIEDIKTPKTFWAEYPYRNEIGCDDKLRDEKLAPMPRTEYAVKVHRQEYYAIISHLDHQIGRILNALEKSGMKDNTYIFYTADHGLSCGHHGLMGKQNMYDHSMAAPMIIIGPDIPKNKKYDIDVYLQDIMPSTLEIAGVNKPEYVEFSSFMDIARGKQKRSAYAAIYGCYKDLQRMIRKDGYKLIVYPKAKKVLLFNLKTDPLEMQDLAGKSKHQKRIREMFTSLIILQEEMKDTLNLTMYFPHLANR
ncbi:MAG: sulfatase-like hydrolase/transferase [Carboxylicivirga sp.]|nr:sulfatase-like hydrolase/transferase [Carboxylicivirga sp.]